MREPVIVAYGRSAVCKSRKGGFSGMHPLEYASQVLNGILDKLPQLDRSEIEDVIVGCAVQHGRASMNMGKLLAARAGLPLPQRSEERRVGKECRSRWSPYH